MLNPAHIQNQANSDMWVQEAIYGHRFIKDQRPFMLVLEALSVCRGRLLDADNKVAGPGPIFPGLPDGPSHETFAIRVPSQAELRFILFEDAELERLASDRSLSPDDKLVRWVRHLNDQGKKTLNREGMFDYLGQRFEGRFQDLLQGVRILRGLEIQVGNERRWTKRFLVPRGPLLHLADMRPGKDGSSKKLLFDRIFFGRGGELVFLMLNRSEKRTALEPLVRQRFFNSHDPMNRMATALSPFTTEATGDSVVGYLPRPKSDVYERLAEDWLAIVSLDRLPVSQMLEPLTRLTALSIIRYFAEVEKEVLGREKVAPLPLDFMDGKSAPLQRFCRSELVASRDSVGFTVAAYVRSALAANPKWPAELAGGTLKKRSEDAVAAISETLRVKDFGEEGAPREPEEWLRQLLKDAENRRNNAIQDVFLPLGRGGGFIAERRRIGTWLCGSDDLLEALVLANVKTVMTFDDFVGALAARYGIVVGAVHAERAYGSLPIASTHLDENVRALERRLTDLGYVRRLSDDCAFVSNPFHGAPS